jgi:hypothetical protein
VTMNNQPGELSVEKRFAVPVEGPTCLLYRRHPCQNLVSESGRIKRCYFRVGGEG